MLNFCTLFDSNYLTRGLALYRSLSSVCPSFHLYVIAFNDNAYDYLKKAGLPNLTPVSLKEFEDEELLKVKATRSIAEYCWTCTPSIVLFCIKTFNLPSCTYIDADMVFYQDPNLLLDEIKGDSIMISEHRYSKEYDQGSTHGIYCVQFTYFKNNETGLTALQWWRERCLEWCYCRLEDGKFGDQKYLDDWQTRFPGVHVMRHPGGGVAPWNLQQYRFSGSGQNIQIKEKKTGIVYPLVFFHFHGLKFFTDGMVSCSGAMYDISYEAKQVVYFPYIKDLLKIEAELRAGHINFNANGASKKAQGRWDTFFEFAKSFLLMAAKGKASLFKLKNYNFNRHYHYYKTDRLK
jgi:hypothetical protein